MFQRDYILRMIEAITHVMARYLKLKARENHEEVLILLEQFYAKLLLPPSKLLLKMSDRELLSLLSINGEPDLDKTVGLALLLKEEGRMYEDSGRDDESSVRFAKSLFLFVASALKGAEVPGIDCGAQIGELRRLLRAYRIPGETLHLLLAYYETGGEYGSAEDVLFELLEAEPESERNLEAGKRFFERIRDVPDEALEAGNLPRREMEQGQAEMLRRFLAPRPKEEQ